MTDSTLLSLATILAVVWVIQALVHHAQIQLLVTGKPWLQRRRADAAGGEAPKVRRMDARSDAFGD
jgi:hypothetical protein